MTREEAWRRTKGYLYDALSGEEADEIIRALEPKTGHWEWQTNSDLETTLCLLPKIQSEDGQDYVQLADVLETVRRYKPSVDKPQERSEELQTRQ